MLKGCTHDASATTASITGAAARPLTGNRGITERELTLQQHYDYA